MPKPQTRRLRINAPETTLSRFGHRVEARENGLMLIAVPEDLFLVTAAELYAELWGGHPGSSNKRVSFNGRSTYALPRVGTEDGHCTYSYPAVPVRISDLVSGYNAVQWALDQGTTFWGHAMVDNACLRVALTNGHPDLVKMGLAGFSATVVAEPVAKGEEGVDLRLETSGDERVAGVEYQGWYASYDDNGNRQETDWHGFTFDRQLRGMVGASRQAPFAVKWGTPMLPAQQAAAVRALVRFRDAPGLVYLTGARTGLVIPERAERIVKLYHPVDLPEHFWSRAGRSIKCHIRLDVEVERVEAAELYVISWTGGAGEVRDYFTLNGRHYPVAEGDGHQLQFNRLPVDPAGLRVGANEIVLLSDTEHHGIEIIYPGPALMVRYRR